MLFKGRVVRSMVFSVLLHRLVLSSELATGLYWGLGIVGVRPHPLLRQTLLKAQPLGPNAVGHGRL